MKSRSIFRQSLIQLTLFYIGIALLFTIFFSIPSFIAQQQARQRLEERIVLRGMNTSRIQQIVHGRVESSAQYFRQTILIVNGSMLLIAAAASYWLARRTLQPLKDILDRQEAFASEVSHELRTPLATILMEIEAFRRTHKKLPTEYSHLLDSITQETKGLGQLSQSVLELMAVDYTDLQALAEKIDLKAEAEQALQQIAPLAEAKKLKLESHLTKTMVKGSRIQLKQLLVIFLDNAVKYTHTGTISLTLRPAGHKAEITIRDTGIGISPEEQKKIFDRFYQTNQQTAEGAGLGLAIAQRILDLHRGSVDITSQPGKGSTFRILLPLV